MDGAGGSLQTRLDGVLADLLRRTPQLEAAAVVSFDGLAMASQLPDGMDEDRVAAMSAALLSLGERAADGLGRGSLSQVFVEGESGTVYLISADDEAVLVAVSDAEAKPGLMLFEVKRAARAVAATLAEPEPEPEQQPIRHDRGAHAAALAELAEPVVPSPTVRPTAEAATSAGTGQTVSAATVATPTIVPAAVAADADEESDSLVADEETVAAPRIVAPRSPADLVPPAAPPTVLAGARGEDEPTDRVGAPNVIWAPNGAKQTWS